MRRLFPLLLLTLTAACGSAFDNPIAPGAPATLKVYAAAVGPDARFTVWYTGLAPDASIPGDGILRLTIPATGGETMELRVTAVAGTPTLKATLSSMVSTILADRTVETTATERSVTVRAVIK